MARRGRMALRAGFVTQGESRQHGHLFFLSPRELSIKAQDPSKAPHALTFWRIAPSSRRVFTLDSLNAGNRALNAPFTVLNSAKLK